MDYISWRVLICVCRCVCSVSSKVVDSAGGDFGMAQGGKGGELSWVLIR